MLSLNYIEWTAYEIPQDLHPFKAFMLSPMIDKLMLICILRM